MKAIHRSIGATLRTTLLATLALAAGATAAEPFRPLRVLFLGDEQEQHLSGQYLPYLMERFGREAIYFDLFRTPACFTDETLARYDVVMVYADQPQLGTEPMAALAKFVESGHGLVAIHAGAASFANQEKYAALVGGRPAFAGGSAQKVTLAKPGHPVLQGITALELNDENFTLSAENPAGREVLLEGGPDGKGSPLAWARTQGNGRVVFIAPGHDDKTWRNPDFQQLVRNAAVWTAGDKATAEWQKALASRDKEEREKNDNVANYERRPEAITFQHPFSVKGSMERTQVPADLRLELFAAEPDIRKPISFAFDERGRCWVAETSDYPHGVKPDGVGTDSIRICEDTDGDGKADKFTVFAEGLNIPTGLVLVNGGVVVSQPPRFLFLKDTNGDDKADVRQEIITGWGIGDTHAQASNLHYGFDNWLYGCVGYSGFEGTVGGQPQRFSQGTYRFKPDGSKLEFLHQFTNNSWAHSQNAWGDQFGGTANGAPIFYGGIPRTAFPDGMRGMSAKRINLVGAAHPITPNYRQVDVMGGYTAAAGSNFIESANLPPRLQGMAMVNEPTMKLIALMDVQQDGAGYVAKDGFNLVASSDEWTSPVYSMVGPDGAVWFADFQNFIIQHNPTPSINRGGYNAKTGPGGAHENPLRDHERGRIYRVVWNKATKPAITTLKGASTAQLVKALSADTQFWRLKAQQLIIEGAKQDAVPALKQLVTTGTDERAAIHALWALQGLGALDEKTHQAALAAKGAGLRRNAVRALGNDEAAQQLLFGSNTLSDPDPVTRLAAMVKLAALPTNSTVTQRVEALASDPLVTKDEWLSQASQLLIRRHQQFKEGENILANSGFEEVDGNSLPNGWAGVDIGENTTNAQVSWSTSTTEKHGGARSLAIATDKPADKAMVIRAQLKPNTNYRLSGWIKTDGVTGRGRALLTDRERKVETAAVTGTSNWREVDAIFNSGTNPQCDIQVSFAGRAGQAWFDDIKLAELTPVAAATEQVAAGDAKRGEDLFRNNPTAGCINCHMLGGKGSTIGPPLDKIASKRDAAYLKQALLEPSATLAEGYNQTPISPMPPMGAILKPQEIADLLAFLQSLK